MASLAPLSVFDPPMTRQGGEPLVQRSTAVSTPGVVNSRAMTKEIARMDLQSIQTPAYYGVVDDRYPVPLDRPFQIRGSLGIETILAATSPADGYAGVDLWDDIVRVILFEAIIPAVSDGQDMSPFTRARSGRSSAATPLSRVNCCPICAPSASER